MKKIIDFVKSFFCKHEWVLLYDSDVRFNEWKSMPMCHQWIFRCKKCGELKYISAKK